MKLAILILFVCSFNSLESGISFIYGENSLKGISLTEDVSFGLTRPAIDSSFTVVLKDVYKDDVLRVPWSGQQEDELNNNSKISIQNSFFSDGGYLSTNSIGYSDPYSGRPYIFTPRDLGITYLFSDFVDNPLRLTNTVSITLHAGTVLDFSNQLVPLPDNLGSMITLQLIPSSTPSYLITQGEVQVISEYKEFTLVFGMIFICIPFLRKLLTRRWS